MIKQLLLFVFLSGSIQLYSQQETHSNKLRLSIPVIWNNSNGVTYLLGSRKEPEGKAVSYGININYTHFVYKNLFLIEGVGYYKQIFGIQRPFEYVTPDGSKPLVSTKKYFYNTIHLLMGVGYEQKLSKKWNLAAQLTYNVYKSYRQRYRQGYFPGENEVYKKDFILGDMINLDIACRKYISSKVSVGLAIVLPLSTRWNDDKIFPGYGYADDTQIAAYTKFSIGTSLSFYYQLKH